VDVEEYMLMFLFLKSNTEEQHCQDGDEVVPDRAVHLPVHADRPELVELLIRRKVQKDHANRFWCHAFLSKRFHGQLPEGKLGTLEMAHRVSSHIFRSLDHHCSDER
jgi:hypothetical protein